MVNRALTEIDRRLVRRTGMPGWAVAPLLVGGVALVTAVTGFFWDVAYHIDHGRDQVLLTPPHVLILLGLLEITVGAVLSIALATVGGARTGWRIRGLQVPFAALPMLLMGLCAVAGFPLDDLWHRTYGIDVTLWSPTHLVMIGAAVFTTFTLALFLAEARSEATGSGFLQWRRVSVLGAILIGLSVFQLEFDFGVPQWQMLFHPLLLMIATGIGLTAARAALGRGGALAAAAFFLVLRGLLALMLIGLHHTVAAFPLMLVSALCVEGAFAIGRPLLAGPLVGTAGLASEWLWTQLWYPMPWHASLLPRMWLPLLAAIVAPVVGLAFGRVVAGGKSGLPASLVAAALVALAALLAVPLPRTAEPLSAHATTQPAGANLVNVEVQLDQPGAAQSADWFTIVAWQGGGRTVAQLQDLGGGRYRATRPVPTGGRWKAIVFLARGDRLIAAPISFPVDPATRRPAVMPAPDMDLRLQSASAMLMSEAHGGPPFVAAAGYAALLLAVLAWTLTLGLAAARISGPPPERGVRRLVVAG